MQTEHLKISGMTCGGCVTNVTNALKAVVGVVEVSVSLANPEATVKYDALKASRDQLGSAVSKAGYELGERPDTKTKQGCC